LIKDEPRGEYPRLVVINRGDAATEDDRMTQGKTTKDSRISKAAEKTQTFDAKKERQIFEEARKEFKGDRASSSKTIPKLREY
jgi:hypothetical protein